MLIKPDVSDLGDKKLNDVENLAKLKEGNAKLTEKLKIHDQALLENTDMARGRQMSSEDFIRLLKRACPELHITDGIEGAVAVRIIQHGPDGIENKYLTGFYKGGMPEFSSVTTDERGVAKREVRGWRSVLLALIKQKVMTFKQVTSVFGDAEGQRSGRWHEQLQERKN